MSVQEWKKMQGLMYLLLGQVFISLRFEERQGIIVTVLAAILSPLRDNLGVEETKGKSEAQDEKGETVSI